MAWSAFVACGLLALVPCLAPTDAVSASASASRSRWPRSRSRSARGPTRRSGTPGRLSTTRPRFARRSTPPPTRRSTGSSPSPRSRSPSPARWRRSIAGRRSWSWWWPSASASRPDCSTMRTRSRSAPSPWRRCCGCRSRRIFATDGAWRRESLSAPSCSRRPSPRLRRAWRRAEARVDWRGWDPFAGSGRTASLRYLWDSHYGGIEFPARPTVVLRVRAPKRAEYWRVSTLETFAADRWIENLYPVDIGAPRRRLPPDPLVPNRDANPGQWLRQTVTVEGLEDDRVAAASQPARVEGESLGRLSYLDGGVMRAGRTVRRGAEYTVWSYAPRPDATRACGLQATLPRRDGPLPRARASPIPRVRRLAARACRRSRVPRREVPAALAVSGALGGGSPPHRSRPLAVRGDAAARAVVPARGWLPVRRAPSGWRRQSAARRLRRGDAPGLLPALRRRDGGHAAAARRPCARRGRLHRRHLEGRGLDGHRSPGPCMGRGVVRRLRLARVRPDAGPGDALCRLHACVGLGGRGPGARHGAVPRFLATLAGQRTTDDPDARRRSGGRAVVPVVADRRCPLLPLAAAVALVGAKWARRARRLRRREPRALASGVRAELVAALVDRGAAVEAVATTADLRLTAERVLATPSGALTDALAEARFGPLRGARAAAVRARAELGHVLDAARSRETPSDRLRAALSPALLDTVGTMTG